MCHALTCADSLAAAGGCGVVRSVSSLLPGIPGTTLLLTGILGLTLRNRCSG